MYQKNEYLFLDEWNENTSITWQRECRIKLNKIIGKFNEWQIHGFKTNEVEELLATIEFGKQTIGSVDGGSGYWDELNKMEVYVKSISKHYK